MLQSDHLPTQGVSKEKPVKQDLWAKFIAEGRQRMRANAYFEWCQSNDRDSKQPVKFNTKNGPILRIAEYYQQAKIVEWANVGQANEKIIQSHSKVW